jgi:general secretion pathway protein C
METWLRRDFEALRFVVIAACAILGAHAIATLVDGRLARVGSPRTSRPTGVEAAELVVDKSGGGIAGRNVFCSSCSVGARALELPTGPRRTTLPLRLLAIMFAPGDPRWSFAILRDTEAKSAGPYAVGGRVREARIAAIGETRVELDVDGRHEFIDLGEAPTPPARVEASPVPAGIERTGEHAFEVRRATVDALLADPAAIASSVRVVPESRDGRPFGFRLARVRADGVFARLGLRDGDVVVAINGLPMSTPDRALEAYGRLATANHLAVALERAGRRLTLEVSIR